MWTAVPVATAAIADGGAEITVPSPKLNWNDAIAAPGLGVVADAVKVTLCPTLGFVGLVAEIVTPVSAHPIPLLTSALLQA